jgi:hypothetical protein
MIVFGAIKRTMTSRQCFSLYFIGLATEYQKIMIDIQ